MEYHSKNIEDKIKELIELAEKEKDNNVFIVMTVLHGSMKMNHSGLFATMVQGIAKGVLQPKMEDEKRNIELLNMSIKN